MSDLKIRANLRSIKILVVEDDSLTCTLFNDILKAMEFKNVTITRRAEEGLVEFAKNDIDLVITDWRLPEMSGLDFVKKVREFEKGDKKYVPIIMVTGRALKQDVESARDHGVTEYLVKPFSVNGLCNKIKSIIENPRKFVLSKGYIGPDRRRRIDQNQIPDGTDRRKT